MGWLNKGPPGGSPRGILGRNPCGDPKNHSKRVPFWDPPGERPLELQGIAIHPSPLEGSKHRLPWPSTQHGQHWVAKAIHLLWMAWPAVWRPRGIPRGGSRSSGTVAHPLPKVYTNFSGIGSFSEGSNGCNTVRKRSFWGVPRGDP